ncbi:MAG: spore maturation protein [Clostridia bacterium]|nr:spore maturation protein [Clostridia bacterium]
MIIENIGTFSAPSLIIIILIFAIKSRINIFDSFIKGAKEGLECMISILPAIIALITAVTIFKSSGALEFTIKLLNPIFSLLKFPKECIPLIIMKPISGSGSNAILNSIFESNSPDSYIGKLSSIISGSSEAIFYIISTYCGSIKLKNTKNIIIFALISFLVSILFARIIC